LAAGKGLRVNDATLKDRAWRRQFLLYAGAACLLGLAGGILEPTLNNFLVDVFHITAKERGALEFPRELPGFLVTIFAGALFFLTEVRMAALAAFIVSLGLWGICFQGHHYSLMLVSLVVWSAGAHLFMPVGDTIALALAGGKQAGTLLGRIGGYSTFAVIVGCLFVWLGRQYLHLSYAAVFATAASAALLGSVVLLGMKPIATVRHSRPKLVFRRRYWLYYVLCVLFGARKQIFITFGPLVLILIFKQPAQTIAKLMIAASVLGIVFKPALGWMIDNLGERFVLMADSVLLVGVCLGYGLARTYLPAPYALYLVYGCYVLDMMLFAMEMARSTYMDKIALSREDVGPTLTLGISINHAVSMSIPALGGVVWQLYGFGWVFVGAAVVAVITLVMASRIRVPKGVSPAREEIEMEAVEEKF
jgi:predicted MFS family arabinose efflux permease